MAVLRPAVVLVLATTLAAGAAAAPSAPHWRTLPAPPVAFAQSQAGAWTGSRLVVIGRTPRTNPAHTVAAAYDPARNRWTKLAPPKGPDYVPGFKALWTGTQLLAFDPFSSLAYTPATGAWRTLPRAINLGYVAWTGREAIGWAGGCCGDAQKDGSAYAPATGRYRTIAATPLGAAQGALGAWTGRALVLFISRYDIDGKPRPASEATAAAYEPASDRWRRLAPFPLRTLSMGAGVWDGRELLVVAAGAHFRDAFAYAPATNRWRRLATLPEPRGGALAVWAGTRLILLGGEDAKGKALRDGLAFDPATNRWTRLPQAPLTGLYGAVAAWDGHELLVASGGRAAALTP